MNQEGKIYALLATARIANVPSVVSNLLVGAFLALALNYQPIIIPWVLCLAAVTIYISANFLNDWMDQKWDAVNRPERALPRGLFPAKTYLIVGIFGLASGLAMFALYGLEAFCFGALLVALVVLYTAVHKHVSWSVIPMGLCRACLPLIGFFAITSEFNWLIAIPSAALFLYVTGLSMSAKNEAMKGAGKKSSWIPLALLIASIVVIHLIYLLPRTSFQIMSLAIMPIYIHAAYTRYNTSVGAHVSALLAGIPLLDLVFMGIVVTSNFQPFISALILICIPATAFVLGRLLQRVAPAT